MRKAQRNARSAGFSLFETTLAMLVLVWVGGSLLAATEGMGRSSSNGQARARLQQEGQEGLRAMRAELARAAFIELGGKQYPYVFDGGVADAPFDAHDHAPPSGEDYDFARGLREIVFVLPSDLDRDERPDRDADRDGVPELDGNSDGVRSDDPDDVAGLWDPALHAIDAETGVVWALREISYVVITDPDGRDALYRRVDGSAAGATRLARGVLELAIDTPASSGFTLPLESVQVRLVVRDRDHRGSVHEQTFESLVRLRNH